MLQIIKLPELHFLQSKLVSATTVGKDTAMLHCLHMKYQWKGKCKEEKEKLTVTMVISYILIVCCESKVSLRLSRQCSFPFCLQQLCLKVSKNLVILVLLIFQLNSLYTATISSANSKAPTFAWITSLYCSNNT